MVWRRKHRVASLHLEHFFSFFFFRCKRVFYEMPNARRIHYLFLFVQCACFRFQALRESKEKLRVRSRALKNCKKNWKRVFFFKCTILTRCLNRVGFEFWDLSRNRNGHVSAVKCRRIFPLSLGTPSFSNLSFCPSWPVCHLREHLYICHIIPHTHSRVFACCSSTLPLLISVMFSSCSLPLLLWCVCLPLPLYLWSITTLLLWRPRKMVTPQLWSCCWERGLTRTPRMR